MNYILKGDPKEVAKVLQENRIRVDRGVIAFIPCQQDPVLDADSIATLREALEASEKSCQEMAEGHVELAGVTRDVLAIVAEKGITVPEDLAARLAQFGIDVPKEPETVEDNKTVDAGTDMKEVNLDDVKDAPEEEVKAKPAPAPKKTRSKKSE